MGNCYQIYHTRADLMSKTEFFKIHQGSKLTNESFLSQDDIP